ncbi:TlpA family protein disulfide reductase [Tomitella fengzijianii]|uniref:TlpA family protein disulfide reductase n=1 Tax=Tomitella fengzijianii TaxID=2597660 RepID=A0A516X047_9ACTN|nr:TlpA disulfide reductase family protein [Tomitella fengzijianii]QDQ96445.1 TlpA family protein disulfide reductase [Tomitella fengzijianii]
MRGLSASAKTGIGVFIVLVALIVAMVMTVMDDDGGPGGSASGTATSSPPSPGPQGEDEQDAGEQDAAPPASDTPLQGLTLTDLYDGRPVDVGSALAGKPAVINLWAYWCAPCREELPAMEQFAQQAGDAVTVLTVHSDLHPDKGRALLEDLGVDLESVADPERKLATAVRAPPVIPVTVLVRPDGTVAKVVAIPFTDADQIAKVVEEELGVTL